MASLWIGLIATVLSFDFITCDPGESLPRPPTNFRTPAISVTSVYLSWSYDVGSENDIYYVIQYKPKQVNQQYREIQNITDMFCLVDGLSPYTEYEFYVIAVNGMGRGSPSTPVVVTTLETSDMPREFRAQDVTPHSMYLLWRRPFSFNPIQYKISYAAHKEFYDEQGNLQKVDIPIHTVFVTANVTEHRVGNLMPFTSYQVNITAIPEDETFKEPATITVTTVVDAPTPMVKPSALGVKNGSEITVVLHKASEENGPISYYFLAVVPTEEAYKDPWEFTVGDLSATPADEVGPYIAAKFLNRSMPEIFPLGDGKMYNGYLNRRLQHDQKYRIFVRAVLHAPRRNIYISSRFSDPLSLDITPTIEPPTVEPPTIEPPTIEPPTIEPGIRDRNDPPNMPNIDCNADKVPIIWFIAIVIVFVLVIFCAIGLFLIKRNSAFFRHRGYRPCLNDTTSTPV